MPLVPLRLAAIRFAIYLASGSDDKALQHSRSVRAAKPGDDRQGHDGMIQTVYCLATGSGFGLSASEFR